MTTEQHGTATGYAYGCREDCCKRAHAAAELDRKSRTHRHPNRRIHVDDVEWMLETNEHPDRIAARLGVTRDSLYRAMHRADRSDLVQRLRVRVAA